MIIIASIVELSDAYTFLIPLQGLFGMSKGSLHVSHIYVRTGASVDAALTALFTRTTSRTIDI